MATNFLELATTLEYLGAKWLPKKRVNFTPCIMVYKFKIINLNDNSSHLSLYYSP